MKKRLISMLLTVLMVASLFGGMSVSAYADEEYATQEYTLKSGDTLLKVCNKLGLNWYSCQTAINKLNNISEAQYRKLSVGQVIKLPATNEDAAKIVKAGTSSGSTGGTVISGGTGSSTSGSTSTSGVNAAYWLIPYTMQKGETVAGVCNVLGISFATYSEQIKTINNISTWSKVAAGKTLLLPSASAPAAGTSCYAVVAHQIQKGETTYSICNQYGVSYNANASLMQTLNKGTSLTNIKYGKTLYVPVVTVAGSSSSSGSSGSTTGGTVISGGTGSSSSGTGSSSTKTYKLSTGTVTNGKISFTVNGKTVTSAAAGSTVTIVASPDSMCGLKSVSLKYADGSAVPKITDSTFTMPACDVVVNATFEKGYYMGPISAHGSVTLYNANNVATTTAAKGTEITVKVQPNAGYLIEKIWIQKNDGSKAVVKDNMKSGDSFTMPDCPVFVRVEYKETATYKLEKAISGSALNGNFVLKVNGSEVTRAAAGATVEVVCSPASGYSAPDDKITIHNNAYGTDTHPINGKFIMPAADVKVTVEFTKGAADKYAIETKDDVNGYGTVTASVKEATAGTTVTLTPWAKAGFAIKEYIVEGSYGKETIKAPDKTFTMPASAVTVTPVFEAVTITYSGCKETGGTGTVTLKANGTTLKKDDTLAYGTTVSVDVKAPTGYEVESISVNGTKISGTSFTVPNASFSVEISYKVKSYTLTVENNWIGFFDLEIDDVKKEVTAADQQITVKYGSSVKIVLKDSSAYKLVGYTLDGETKTGDSFTMPGANTKVMALVEPVAKASSLSLEEPETLVLEP